MTLNDCRVNSGPVGSKQNKYRGSRHMMADGTGVVKPAGNASTNT